MKKDKPELKRYRLDVSAQFYPIISTKKAQSLFRLSAVMDKKVDGGILQRAAEDVLVRFPTFKVRLKKGYAWYYFSPACCQTLSSAFRRPVPFPSLSSSGSFIPDLRRDILSAYVTKATG